MQKQKGVDISIFHLLKKEKMKSLGSISCAELAISVYDILYPKRSTEQIGIDLGIPTGYNKALI